MYNKNCIIHLKDMLQACEEIEKIVEAISFLDFEQDSIRYRALERLLEVIGEAANRVSKDEQLKFPHIPWKNIIGMRNVIIHCYEKIELSTLWATAKKDIPGLKVQLISMISVTENFD